VEMAKGMMEIWSRVAEPSERFRALGIGYVRFALVENEQRIRQALRGLKTLSGR